jgi:hypothetical protein
MCMMSESSSASMCATGLFDIEAVRDEEEDEMDRLSLWSFVALLLVDAKATRFGLDEAAEAVESPLSCRPCCELVFKGYCGLTAAPQAVGHSGCRKLICF